MEDETALKGKFDFILNFLARGLIGPNGPGGVSSSPPAGPGEEDLFEAMQSQLGLKLEPKKAPVELIVVDRIEKTPTEN